MSAQAQEQTARNNGWSTSGGDNSRRGLFPGSARPSATVLHRLPAHGAIQASVIFDANGTAYVADMAGHMQAFDQQGKLRWQARTEGGISATPVLHSSGKRLHVGTLAGWVHTLDAVAGEEVWRQRLPSSSDPRILSDLLYLPGQDAIVLSSWGGRFHALEAASGKEKYSWDAGISPAAGAAADKDEALYCVRTGQGRVVQFVRVAPGGTEKVLHEAVGRLRDARRAMVAAAPVLDEALGVAYYIANLDRESVLHAYALKTDALAWGQRLSLGTCATPALMKDGTVLAASLDGTLHAIAPDGSLAYRYVSGSDYLLAGPVCDGEGNVCVGDTNGAVHCVNRKGLGQILFEAPRSIQARPSFDSEGRLYVPCTDRTVYVFARG